MLAIEIFIENDITATTRPSIINLGNNSNGGMAGGGNLCHKRFINISQI